MTQKEKLIKLIDKSDVRLCADIRIDLLADFLMEHGVEVRGEQVARKPTKVVYPRTDLTSHYVCWACSERVCNGWKYCPECGQAIDWKGDKNDG